MRSFTCFQLHYIIMQNFIHQHMSDHVKKNYLVLQNPICYLNEGKEK